MIIYSYAETYKRQSGKEDMRNAKCLRWLTFRKLVIRLKRFQISWIMEKKKTWNDFKLQGIYNKKFQQSGLLSPGVDESLKETVD